MNAGTPNPPSPMLFFETANAFQRSAALKSAVDLDLFSAIAAGDGTAADAARRCKSAERGVRILADFLTICGFLTKTQGRYALTPDSAMFLDRRSPAFLGGALEFLLSPMSTEGFTCLTDAVRKGGTAVDQDGTVAPEHEIWVKFARAMGPMMAPVAQQVVATVKAAPSAPLRVLDIAAGHGEYGLAFAAAHPAATVTGLDWPNVLEVAKEHAAQRGVAARYRTIPGSAFDVDLGGPYDVVLLPNFLHHFDPAACETLLKKIRAALVPAGTLATVEFIPNEDRVTPPSAAGFALIMLAHTPAGDAYTFKELEGMLQRAGFNSNDLKDLPPTTSRLIVSR